MVILRQGDLEIRAIQALLQYIKVDFYWQTQNETSIKTARLTGIIFL